MSCKPVPRWKQRLGGLLIMLIGAWGWYTVLSKGSNAKLSMLFPFFFIMGLALIIFPGYTEERIARGEDVSGLSGIELITPRWWAIMVVGLAAGFGNYLFLSFR